MMYTVNTVSKVALMMVFALEVAGAMAEASIMASKLKMAYTLAFVLLLGLNLAMAVALKIPMRLELTIHGTSAVITVKNENKHIEQVHF